jgi:Flp pilus assembly pilin Flp
MLCSKFRLGYLKKTSKGAGLVEYGMLVGLISVLGVVSVSATGGQVRSVFCTVSDEITGALWGEEAECLAQVQIASSPLPTTEVDSGEGSAPIEPPSTITAFTIASDVYTDISGMDFRIDGFSGPHTFVVTAMSSDETEITRVPMALTGGTRIESVDLAQKASEAGATYGRYGLFKGEILRDSDNTVLETVYFRNSDSNVGIASEGEDAFTSAYANAALSYNGELQHASDGTYVVAYDGQEKGLFHIWQESNMSYLGSIDWSAAASSDSVAGIVPIGSGRFAVSTDDNGSQFAVLDASTLGFASGYPSTFPKGGSASINFSTMKYSNDFVYTIENYSGSNRIVKRHTSNFQVVQAGYWSTSLSFDMNNEFIVQIGNRGGQLYLEVYRYQDISNPMQWVPLNTSQNNVGGSLDIDVGPVWASAQVLQSNNPNAYKRYQFINLQSGQVKYWDVSNAEYVQGVSNLPDASHMIGNKLYIYKPDTDNSGDEGFISYNIDGQSVGVVPINRLVSSLDDITTNANGGTGFLSPTGSLIYANVEEMAYNMNMQGMYTFGSLRKITLP